MKKFQARFEVLHRLHLNQWASAFWHLANHSAALLQQSSFLSVFVDPVSVSLLVLEVTLIGRSRDFVDPRLLNLRPAKMNVEVFAHAISSLLERPLCSADGGGPVAGDEGFTSENSSSDTSSASGVTKGRICGSCGTCA